MFDDGHADNTCLISIYLSGKHLFHAISDGWPLLMLSSSFQSFPPAFQRKVSFFPSGTFVTSLIFMWSHSEEQDFKPFATTTTGAYALIRDEVNAQAFCLTICTRLCTEMLSLSDEKTRSVFKKDSVS